MEESYRKKQRINMIILLTIIAVAIIVIYQAITQTIDYKYASENYETTTGVLVEHRRYDSSTVDDRRISYGGIYEYVVDGEEYTTAGIARHNSPDYVAERIAINYNPENPDEVNKTYTFTLGVLYVLVVIFAIAVIVILRVIIKDNKKYREIIDLN